MEKFNEINLHNKKNEKETVKKLTLMKRNFC